MPLFRPHLIIFIIKSNLYFIIHVLYRLHWLLFDDDLFVRQLRNYFVKASLDITEVNWRVTIRLNSTLAFFGLGILFEVKLIFCF